MPGFDREDENESFKNSLEDPKFGFKFADLIEVWVFFGAILNKDYSSKEQNIFILRWYKPNLS